MGRAERRLAERRNRIEERKGKILMSREDLNGIKEDLSYQASGYIVKALTSCFALVMSRKGFDQDYISECLESVNALMDDILDGKATMEDYMKELEDTTGIAVVCKEK